jgi:hypothetical protein
MSARRLLPVLPALFLLVETLHAAPPPKPAPPPEVGVKAVTVSGARRVDAVLPGRLLATAFPHGADGRRRVVALVAAEPDSPRELYLLDTAGNGSQRRLLGDLPAKATALTAIGSEIILGAPGTSWSLGTVDAPAPPHRFLDGVDARHLLGADGRSGLAVADVGRLRTWTSEDGKLTPGASYELPVHASRERGALRLDTPEVEMLPQGGNAPPLYLVGPETNGKTRLHTLLLTRDAEGKEQRSEAWSRFARPETVDDHWFVRFDGQPSLIVTTNSADKVSIFEEQSLRVFSLAADRSRAGQPPRLAVPTVSRRWFPARPFVLDLDRDGHDDLVVVQQEGLRGKSLLIETWFAPGGRFATPSRKISLDIEARTWDYGADLTGDGRPDLVALQGKKLLLFAGTADPHRDLLDRRPRLAIDLPSSEQVMVSVEAGDGGASVDSSRSASPLQLIDLDGDGRPEAIVTVRDDGGRGRVTVVRVGG